MGQIISKSKLAIALSKLKVFEKPKVELEQYPTESEIAAEILWNAALLGDIVGNNIVDMGCGTGILGIGALLLGAESVFFLDIDKDALAICAENIEFAKNTSGFEGSYIEKNSKVSSIDVVGDVVIQNPPFGVKNKHADREFLNKALEVAPTVYSMHLAETKKFVHKFVDENNAEITHYWEFLFPIKQSMEFHKKRIERIKVGCWRIVKNR